MIVSNLRPLLLLLAGAAVGSLVTIGVQIQRPSSQEALVQSEHAPKTLRATSPGENEQNLGTPAPTLSADTLDASDSEEAAAVREKMALLAGKQHIPVRPLPKPTMAFQANGLPVGVTADAGKSEVYKRLPGVQPPLINRDGRDLGPEATQMLETRVETPFPGGLPSVSATPMPFPQTVEEANRQAYASPTPFK